MYNTILVTINYSINIIYNNRLQLQYLIIFVLWFLIL